MLCHACKCHVAPRPPRSAWKILNVALWSASMAVAMVFSLIIGLNLLLAPLAIVIGMSIGTSARRLSSWTCPRCGAELVEPETEAVLIPSGPIGLQPATT
jgi:hypothetical protein